MATTSRPRTLDPATRRNDILRAASEVFAKRGFHNTRISDIADKAGVAQGTIYRFFESKEELAAALVARATAVMQEFAERALGDTEAEGATAHALDRFIDTAAEYYARNRRGLKALHSWTSDPTTRQVMSGLTDELHDTIAKLVKAAGARVWQPDGVEVSRLLLLELYSLSAEQEQYQAKIDHAMVARIVKRMILADEE